MVPAAAPAVERTTVAPDPPTEPEVELKLYVSGRFCGLTPIAVMVEGLPDVTVTGLAVQLTVGGSFALTTYGAVQSAFSPGLSPSET